ncbi:MAG: hypothetical protein ACK47B_21735 [Armatimonadota bacterium]
MLDLASEQERVERQREAWAREFAYVCTAAGLSELQVICLRGLVQGKNAEQVATEQGSGPAPTYPAKPTRKALKAYWRQVHRRLHRIVQGTEQAVERVFQRFPEQCQEAKHAHRSEILQCVRNRFHDWSQERVCREEMASERDRLPKATLVGPAELRGLNRTEQVRAFARGLTPLSV